MDYKQIELLFIRLAVVIGEIKANAKLTIFLHITNRRNDGYHIIQSLMYPISLHDIIKIYPSSQTSVTFLGAHTNNIDPYNNTIMKMLNQFKTTFNTNIPYHFEVTKNIPVCSGMGGSATDCAAILRHIPSLLGVSSEDIRIPKLGQTIGADVEICRVNKPAMVSGTGEIVEILSKEEINDFIHRYGQYVILIHPITGVSAIDCYKTFAKEKYNFAEVINTSYANIDLLNDAYNALQHPAHTLLLKQSIDINSIVSSIQTQSGCALARMSGSGSTCYGIFHTKQDLESAYDNLYSLYPDYWLHKCNFLTSTE